MTEEVSAQAIIARLQAEAPVSTAGLHRIRRQLSKQMQPMEGEAVIAIAQRLARSTDVPGARMTAYGLIGWHSKALNVINEGQLEQLAGDLSSWGHVDMFACLLAGRAWRDGAIQTATIHRWARSKSRWWRRAALAATVPLNVKSQGGVGDSKRTLAVCDLLSRDRDDMVVKALSWALRELATRDSAPVRQFIRDHEDHLAARVMREVQNKLTTGLKNPRRT